jgi:hypothetical protein
MNVLDENIVAQQGEQLRQWRIPFRQIGSHLSAHGALDENLIPVLHRLPQSTFFTHDNDFFKAALCHPHYALVYLDVGDTETAEFSRRFLRHPAFDSNAKWMGIVARARVGGIQYWKKGKSTLESAKWSEFT